MIDDRAKGEIETVKLQPDTFIRWILSICASLIAAGVVALWHLGAHVAQLEERMAGWTRSMTEQISIMQQRDIEITKQVSELGNSVNVNSAALGRFREQIDRKETPLAKDVAELAKQVREHEQMVIRNTGRFDDILRRLQAVEQRK